MPKEPGSDHLILEAADPVHQYLATDIFDSRDGRPPAEAVIEARPLVWNGAVILFTETRTGERAVGKFYARKPVSGSANVALLQAGFMRRELHNLEMLHANGLGRGSRRAVRALGANERLGCLLVQEFATGRSLHAIAEEAALTRDTGILAACLGSVAHFLAALHRCGEGATWAQAGDPASRLTRLAGQLADLGLLDPAGANHVQELAGLWRASGLLQDTAPVLVHGDATPPHFIFGASPEEVTVIDFERLWPGDPAADLGSMAAELKHLFWRFAGDPWASEPLIQHLYRVYQSLAGPDPSLTTRTRYYQGVQQLRIGRNAWLGPDLRRALVNDGLRCLAAP